MTDVIISVTDRRYLPASGERYMRSISHPKPLRVGIGDRLYIAYRGSLWGWCPVHAVHPNSDKVSRISCGEARPCSLPCRVRHRGRWQYRWWDRAAEIERKDDEI